MLTSSKPVSLTAAAAVLESNTEFRALTELKHLILFDSPDVIWVDPQNFLGRKHPFLPRLEVQPLPHIPKSLSPGLVKCFCLVAINLAAVLQKVRPLKLWLSSKGAVILLLNLEDLPE